MDRTRCTFTDHFLSLDLVAKVGNMIEKPWRTMIENMNSEEQSALMTLIKNKERKETQSEQSFVLDEGQLAEVGDHTDGALRPGNTGSDRADDGREASSSITEKVQEAEVEEVGIFDLLSQYLENEGVRKHLHRW
jgi:hypothetical protein